MQALFLVLAVVFWLLSAGVTRPGWDQAAGWVGLCVAGIAFYGAAAELLNEYYHKVGLREVRGQKCLGVWGGGVGYIYGGGC